jgi:hypothetical protein
MWRRRHQPESREDVVMARVDLLEGNATYLLRQPGQSVPAWACVNAVAHFQDPQVHQPEAPPPKPAAKTSPISRLPTRKVHYPMATHQPDQAIFKSVLPEDIQWKPFPAFPPTARLAIVVGEPS